MIGAPLAQGLANAGLTIRVGLKAQEQCRPLLVPPEKKVGTLRMLLSSVADTVRRLLRGRQKPNAPLELDETPLEDVES